MAHTMTSQFQISLPPWAVDELQQQPGALPNLEDRMREVIRFSRLNIEHETGGPFAAGVFEAESGRLITIGVNRVVPGHCSSAHAEVVALSLAQQSLGSFDLGATGMPAYQLVVNWRPCAMCYGAVIWSGIRSLIIAGSGPELEVTTGFDEGPIHPDWRGELLKRDIHLVDNLLKEEACLVFEQFAESGALVYNGRSAVTD